MDGYFSEEALEAYSKLAADSNGTEFAEGEDSYDFARCVRADGTFYGTRGKCRQGTETGPAEKKEGTGARGAREAAAAAKAEGKKGGEINRARAAGKKEALAAARAEGGKKVSANSRRTRLFQEELEKVREKIKGAGPEEVARIQREAFARAEKRAAAGEDVAKAKPSRTKEEQRDREAVTKMGRSEKDLTPSERAARAERQKAGAANRSAQAGTADAAKRAEKTAKKTKGPHHAQLTEIKAAIKGKLPDLRQRKQELDRLERAYKAQEKKTKAEPSKENKARLKEVIRQANEQERHFNRLSKEIEKMSRQYHSLNKRNEKARMSPAQRKEANRLEALIRKLG